MQTSVIYFPLHIRQHNMNLFSFMIIFAFVMVYLNNIFILF